ncbi:MAG: sugar kinase [Pirellulaceae bacterium]|nr:sugar kinase [Pirellulaceae bacterium]
MPLCVVGSVALDSVETPSETRDNVLGGSAVYFSYAASFFTSVRLAGVVGEDWPSRNTEMLIARGIDTAGLQVIEGGKTFRWRGKYMRDMNQRETLDLQLNVLGDFEPILPEDYRHCPFVFLANGSPEHQLKTLDQCQGAKLVVADTMDHYIRSEREGLLQLLKRIDGLVLNDGEAKLLTDDDNLVRAGNAIRLMGPKFVVIKKGEHGAIFFGETETYVLPAFPTPDVVDPTGAGDSFAGGMMGYLAEKDCHNPKTLKEALAYGTLTASFTVEDFSLDRLQAIGRKDLDRRMEEYRKILSF